jgi:cytochrome c peroxidase
MRGKNHTEATIFPEIVVRLRAIPGYVDRFDAAFPNRPSEEAGDRIAKETIVRAIAAFERTLVTRPS